MHATLLAQLGLPYNLFQLTPQNDKEKQWADVTIYILEKNNIPPCPPENLKTPGVLSFCSLNKAPSKSEAILATIHKEL